MEGLLLGITQLKQELDSIDEDLNMHIRKTMDVEAHILRTSEEVKILTEEEEGCQLGIISLEDRLQSVTLLAEVSRHSVLQEKTQYFEQLNCENQGLSAQLQENTSKNEKIMEEIEGYNKNLLELQANNRRMSGEIQENDEAIRQLKDLVLGLQMKLSNLMEQS